jgi:hypothetical protein
VKRLLGEEAPLERDVVRYQDRPGTEPPELAQRVRRDRRPGDIGVTQPVDPLSRARAGRHRIHQCRVLVEDPPVAAEDDCREFDDPVLATQAGGLQVNRRVHNSAAVRTGRLPGQFRHRQPRRMREIH